MNRIANLKVLFATAAAVAVIVVACSNPSNNPMEGSEPGEDSPSTSSGSGDGQENPPFAGNPDTSSPSQGQVSSNSSGGGSSNSSGRSSSSAVSIPVTPIDPQSFTETVNGVSFDMIYITGGTFTLGCEKESGCPADSKPVTGVQVSNYFIGKTEMTTGLWHAVMGGSASSYSRNSSFTTMTWYDAHKFACKLSELTGKNYRMTTEAEWEYAAKNHLSSLEKVGSQEEWAYNSWSGTHTGGVDPIGPKTQKDGVIHWGHTQKTRRDAQGTADNITGRLIRSIEGQGPALRLALSKDVAFPPDMVPSCNIHAPEMGDEPENSYRDKRWVTGSDARWTVPAGDGTIAIGSFDLRVWDDGTATMTSNNYGYGSSRPSEGQWFTSNNIMLVFVSNSGSIRKYKYIFLNEEEGSLISDQGFMNGGFIGRIVKESASNVDKPSIPDLKSGEDLAKAQTDFETDFKMVDMVNIPASAQKQDKRLLDGLDSGWFQDNRSAGGVHHYRKDVDLDEFRFTVNQGGGRVMLANGKWFTVNNTFLRVTHSSGYTADYLYAVDSDGTFYHNSFMGYERGDFRMFKKTLNNSSTFSSTCGSICSGEIPKGEGASMYNRMENGQSTFKPAPCPSGGCR